MPAAFQALRNESDGGDPGSHHHHERSVKPPPGLEGGLPPPNGWGQEERLSRRRRRPPPLTPLPRPREQTLVPEVPRDEVGPSSDHGSVSSEHGEDQRRQRAPHLWSPSPRYGQTRLPGRPLSTSSSSSPDPSIPIPPPLSPSQQTRLPPPPEWPLGPFQQPQNPIATWKLAGLPLPRLSKRSHGSKHSRSSRRGSFAAADGTSSSSVSDEDPTTDSIVSSTFVDPIHHRNQRQFPPRLPTSMRRPSSRSANKAATSRIFQWFGNFEKSSRGEQAFQRSMDDVPHPETSISGRGLIYNHEQFSDPEPASVDEVGHLWVQIKEKRDRLADLKVDMARMRRELRDIRQRNFDSDNAFMRTIRPVFVGDQLSHTARDLQNQFARMQSLRTEYHDLESKYENSELTMDKEEQKLYDLETRFFDLLATGKTRMPRQWHSRRDSSESRAQGLTQDLPFELRGISASGPTEGLHPLYLQLASITGDLENAKEELDDLLATKELYDFDKEMRRQKEMTIPEELEDFVQEFPTAEREMSAAVDRIQKKFVRLRHICETKNIMERHMPFSMAYKLNPGVEHEDLFLDDTSPTTLAHPRFSELLTQPDHVLANPIPLTCWAALKEAHMLSDDSPHKKRKLREASKECAIERAAHYSVEGDSCQVVNRWLLQQLRTSPFNAEILYSTFTSTVNMRIRDPWRWQYDVLHYWGKDGICGDYGFSAPHNSQRQASVGVQAGSERSSARSRTRSRAASDSIAVPENKRLHYRRTVSPNAAASDGGFFAG